MKNPPPNFSRLYKSSLYSHLKKGSSAVSDSIKKIRKEALVHELSSLDIAGLHKQLLFDHILPNNSAKKRTALIRSPMKFFAVVVTAEKKGNVGADTTNLEKTIAQLSAQNAELAIAKRAMDLDIIKRKRVETHLRSCEQNCFKALRESDELNRNISETQKVITKSANIVYHFARELRPLLLDHLGLIPALRSYLKNFTIRTGIRTHLRVFEGIELLDPMKVIVLYRVIQEALTNISRHAHASRVEVAIIEQLDFVSVEINDDGKSFQIQDVMTGRGRKKLGLLGMKERIEMVGGTFKIDSIPGSCTTIKASIPNVSNSKRKVKLQ